MDDQVTKGTTAGSQDLPHLVNDTNSTVIGWSGNMADRRNEGPLKG